MKTRFNSPFVIPVRDIVRKPGEMREHELDITLSERWGEGIVAFEKDSELLLDVRLESVHEGILVTGTAEATYSGECGRCLEPISAPVEVEIQELFAYPGEEATDFEVQDDHVDLETLVRDAAVLSLPFQPVCQPDCLGLDPETGEKLTEGKGADAAAPIDPRWSALQQITDQGTTAERRAPENTEGS
ncbi:metal-binding protein [Microbacterium keratanolyticum]|uniref:Metal-binding protein n=2 Tax=Microbacterium keratanolyticum TaxID=67574 RepID=A0A9W6HTI9_9MICO|nr:metal-binding protein [Microbacterium keratanolyticum]